MRLGRAGSILICLSLSLVFALPARATKTAFRINDMDWRDPHIFIDAVGCRDVTDTAFFGFSMNGDLQSRLQGDSDADSLLDLSYLIIFDPLDQAGAGGTLSFGPAECTAPLVETSCEQSSAPATYAYDNVPATCLGILAGTVRPYSPVVGSSAPPCFVAYLGTVTIDILGGIPLTLNDAHLAATYVGTPATLLANGLLRGFVTETDANNTIIPASYPLIGGKALSSLFPGGDPPGTGNTNCASHSDKDIGPGGVPGWYVYFNFRAAQVPYSEPATPVRDVAPMALALDVPHPNPFNPTTTIRYRLPSASHARVAIYDASGRLVTQLVNEEQMEGAHAVSWNGRDARGAVVGSGVYFVRLESNGESRTQKTVLLK